MSRKVLYQSQLQAKLQKCNVGHKGNATIVFFATSNIKMGEEITFAYGWTLLEASLNRGLGMKCLCGEKDCSGAIKGQSIEREII
jgi:SET domain-containing protein